MKKFFVLFAFIPVIFLSGCTVTKSYVAQDVSKDRVFEAITDFAESRGYYNNYSNDKTGIYGFTDKVFEVKKYNTVFSQSGYEPYGRTSYSDPRGVIPPTSLKMKGKKVHIFDCFAGCGGFRLGFELEGFKAIGYCEKDKYASQLYSAYYDTKGEIYYSDATQIDTRTMPDFGIFTGGFPCQPFSVAGKRQGFKDTRGTLFFEIARICEDKKPQYIVLENVKGLLSHDNGRTFATIIGILSDIGYKLPVSLLYGLR